MKFGEIIAWLVIIFFIWVWWANRDERLRREAEYREEQAARERAIAEKKKQMGKWTPRQLHAYAGVKSHPEELRSWAYHMAKQKQFNNSFRRKK